ncbi:Homeodomain 1 mating type protein [Mycena venus]|uniref:Homeodomain 1 mating type protein n=1 Tax=Mycena venus TaxID=2733690 RepID=A0A8H6XWL7_9AGAR|nr:Homeodomain 1 mating type protein [Mycena venus]
MRRRKPLTYIVASRITISANLFLSVKTDTELVDQLEGCLGPLWTSTRQPSDDSDASSDSITVPPSSSVHPDPSLPPYIEPAYKWLLENLDNPYPKKETKERIAHETGSSR